MRCTPKVVAHLDGFRHAIPFEHEPIRTVGWCRVTVRVCVASSQRER